MRTKLLLVLVSAVMLCGLLFFGVAANRPPKKRRANPAPAHIPVPRRLGTLEDNTFWGAIHQVDADVSVPGQLTLVVAVELWHGVNMRREMGLGKFVVAVEDYGGTSPLLEATAKPIASSLSVPFASVYGHSVKPIVKVSLPAGSGAHYMYVRLYSTAIDPDAFDTPDGPMPVCLNSHYYPVEVP